MMYLNEREFISGVKNFLRTQKYAMEFGKSMEVA